jgi:polysaccharide deacetylase family protein (PEP-CTERM system associated)
LAEAGLRATFFILGSVAEQRPDLVKKIAGLGHNIGTHGYSHRLLYKPGKEQFSDELKRSLDILQNLTGRPVRSHRAAFFSITKQSLWALDVLLEEGLAIDSSIFPVRNYRYGIPDAPRHPYWHERNGRKLLEFPISTIRLFGNNLPFSGGFYLRLLPYPLLHQAFSYMNRRGYPAVLYIHPWELDPKHPRLPLPRRIALPHYHNLHSTEGKLRRLLKNFSFAPLEEIADGGRA